MGILYHSNIALKHHIDSVKRQPIDYATIMTLACKRERRDHLSLEKKKKKPMK